MSPTNQALLIDHPKRYSYLSSSLDETYLFASRLVQSLEKNTTISLEGPLGAGKTHLVQGMAMALKIEEPVTSPTFTLLQSYKKGGTLILHHFDFYRMETEKEAVALGIDDYFQEGICVIEWGNKFPQLLPQKTIRIAINPLSEHQREFSWNISFPALQNI